MLYTTTRSNSDIFTAQRVLTANRGPDGGHFLPFRIPQFSELEIQNLAAMNFNGRVAQILNLLFGSCLTSYDLDLALGKAPVRLKQLGKRLIIAQCWHNTDWNFGRMVQDVTALLAAKKDEELQIKGWAEVGVRIAVLFGIFGELIREKKSDSDHRVDISMVTGDFDGPMSAWYARYMGLPIGDVICCCNENANLWDFFCHGQLRCDSVAHDAAVTECNSAVPEGLERLISLYGGPEEIQRYVDCLHRGGTYYVEDALLHRMRQGIYATVSSDRRIVSTIPSAFSTHGYLLEPAAALAYAGLQDYQTRTEHMRMSLVMTEKSPALEADSVAAALQISRETLMTYLKK